MDVARYFKPHGRFRRTHYWVAMAAIGVVMPIADLTDNAILAIFSVFLAWPAAMISIQRGHDFGQRTIITAIVYALGAIGRTLITVKAGPAIGSLLILPTMGTMMLIPLMVMGCWLAFAKGDEGPNTYGSNPRMPPRLHGSR